MIGPILSVSGRMSFLMVLAVPLAASPAEAGAPKAAEKGGRGSIADHLQRSRELEKKKDIDGALAACQEAFFLVPEDESLAAQVRRLSALAAGARMKQAKTLLKTDREKAVSLLVASHEIVPSKEAASSLKSLGYTLHSGAWRTGEQIETWKRKESDEEKEARERMKLGPGFTKYRSDHFRLFSDLPPGPTSEKWLDPLLKVLESLFEKYRWTFQGELGDTKDTCLHLVFFKDEGTYQGYRRARVKSETFRTAGYYDPNVRSSFFYRETGYGDVYPVLLHELTHQMNEEVLQAACYLAFVNEGLAQYFEAAIVNPKNFLLTVGRPDFGALSYLKEQRIIGSSRSIPAKTILSARGVDELVRGGFPTKQVYAEMWAWTYFLLHNETRHRVLLLDCIRKERAAIRGEGAGDDLPRHPAELYALVFAAHGLPIETIDEEFRTFLKEFPWSGKGKAAR